ncbi:eukaryotic aspartyl protease, partial [Ancylostoma duodenale]
AEFDGMIGLAFYTTDGARSKPFIMSLIDQGYLDKPIFTVWFAQQNIQSGKAGGMITYGGFDSENCGDVIGYESLSSPYYYQYKINSVAMGGFSYERRVDVTQGFGTWIAGPKPITDRFAKDVGAHYNQDGLYDIDCGTKVPSLYITADKIKFEIKSENLVVKLDNGKCLLGFLPMGSSSYGPSWHMGALFTRQYCTIFDIGEGRIGFADSIRKEIEISTKTPTTPTQKPATAST